MATDTMRRTTSPLAPPRRAQQRGLGRKVPPLEDPGGSAPRASAVTAPRHARPVTPARPANRPVPGPVRHAGTRSRSPRMPFILLLVGLLGGALVSMLVISTTLAQGSFRITNLQQQNVNLAHQEQILTNEVAQESNPAVIAKAAKRLGMRPNPRLGFIDPTTGKIVVGKPSGAEAAIKVPGYTP